MSGKHQRVSKGVAVRDSNQAQASRKPTKDQRVLPTLRRILSGRDQKAE